MSKLALITHGAVALASATLGAILFMVMSAPPADPDGLITLKVPAEGVIYLTQGVASLSMPYKIEAGELAVETQLGRFMRMEMPSDGVLRDPIVRIGAR